MEDPARRETRYHALFESLAEPAFVLDPESGRVLEVNPAAARLYGYASPSEMVGMGVADYSAEPDQTAKALREGEVAVPLRFHRRKDGTTFPVEVLASAATVEGRKAILGIVRDLTERQRRERELENARMLLQSCIESPADMVIMAVDRDYRYLCFNQAHRAAMKLAYGTDVELGMNVLECMSSDVDRRNAKANYDRALAGDPHSTIQEYGDIHRSCFESLYNPILNSAGEIVGLTAYARDITARKRAEDALREREAVLKSITDTIPEPIFVKDRESRWTFANPALLKVVGKPLDQVLGKTDLEIYADPRVGRALMETDSRIMEGGAPEEAEEIVQTPDGYRTYLSMKAPVLQPDGRVIGLAGVALDITERKRAEAKLNDEQERLRAILDTVGDPIFVKDDDHRITLANRAFCDMFDLDEDAVIGKTLAEHVPPDERRHFLAIDRGVLDTGEPNVCEETLTVKTRPTRTIVTRKARFSDSSGNRFLVGSIHDIAERKRVEVAFRAAVEQHQAMVRSIADGIISIDSAGLIVAFNPAAERLFGYAEREVLGQPLTLLQPARHQARHQAGMERASRGEPRLVGSTVEVEGRRKDGSEFPLTLSLSGWEAGQGRFFTGIIHDLTERRRAGAILDESRERYRRLFVEAPMGIALIDSSTGRMLEVNPAFARIAGRPVEEMVSLDWMSITHPDDVQADLDNMARLNAGQIEGFQMEKRYLRPDGPVVWISMTIARATTEDAGHPRHLCMIEDVTRRKQAEAERAGLEAQLRQAQKMESVGRLAGGVAHDFNNMLSVIQGNAEVALMDLDPTRPPHGELEEILRAADRAADLTRQLLAFARKQTIVPSVLDLNACVTSLLGMLRRLIGEDIELAWRSGAGLWPVKMDPSQLDQILANLCVNARDAIADVGTITIEAANHTVSEDDRRSRSSVVPGEYVRLRVGDNGSGMSGETLEHIFEPFFTTKGVGEGTGLGLATVYGAVKQNEGFIEVASEPGQGTTFTIYLPRHVGRGQQAGSGDAPAPPERGHETVLLVEDELAILKPTQTALERLGYTVLSASTPGEALSLAREHTGDIDLLVTDVVMPEMNGRDLAKSVLALHPRISRLFMSGYTADVIAHRGVLDERMHFLQKPFSMADLATKVRKALDGEEM